MGFEWWLLPVIALPGGVGAVGRYLLDTHLKVVRGWPPVKSVAVVNLVGTGLLASLTLIAVFITVPLEKGAVTTAVMMGVASLAGGFTTFSTAMVEAVKDRQGAVANFMTLLLVLVMCCLLYVAILVLGYLGVAGTTSSR
ncbi:CrcB family protein [Corynebacterium urogenitale]